MITGLIEKVANIAEREINSGAGKLTLHLESQFDKLVKGESIAVNGVCLTVEKFDDSTITFHVLNETFTKSNIGEIAMGGKVNLERALAVGARLGGHMVSGHVDTTSDVISWTETGTDWILTVALPESIKPFMVTKGSITIDGVSLTIAELKDDSFSVHLIPTTLSETALFERQPGLKVNLEADIIGKYVVKQLSAYQGAQPSNISMDTLADAGW
jgi:riboflavin synthase